MSLSWKPGRRAKIAHPHRPPQIPSLSRCKKCLLPANAPGADLDVAGVCAPCRTWRPADEAALEASRAARERDLEDALAKAPSAGAPYDALVCLSGGKDSLYLLHRAVVDFGLRVLAFTTDVSIPDIAWKNIRRTIAKLGVDHLVYRPADAFYRKLFAHLLRHQEARGAVYTVSYVYAPLFEGDALAAATERGIPLVLAGYSPGQPEPERMEYEFSRVLVERTDWTPPALRTCGAFTDAELARFWNARRYAPGTRLPRYLAPFHAWRYDQEAVMREVHRLGLVERRGHASPIVSNYPINWLLMYSDLRHFGYNPYAPEFAALIRRGKASLAYWRVMTPVVNQMIRRRAFLGRDVARQMRLLGLADRDLVIDQPRGAYDPEPA
jgi:hypothetical protein